MANLALADFIAHSAACATQLADPADCVAALAPVMHTLLAQADSFLEPQHLQPDPQHYARHAIYVAPDQSLSLYAIVWTPGQWTPVHDHGSWGVVGVLRGMLEERSYIRMSADPAADTGIALARGGVILLAPGTVTSFVPNPDHIHVTGVAADRAPVVSLHLYGRNMDSFHVYDLAAGSRKRVTVPHS
jgi:predicted metal-dependent enzyme (double-stranded beta helix superfamily)